MPRVLFALMVAFSIFSIQGCLSPKLKGKSLSANATTSSATSTSPIVYAPVSWFGLKQFGNTTIGAGASGQEFPVAITVDVNGSTVIAGQTAGAFAEANAGSNDIFVVKLSANGTIQWKKQYGNVTIGAAAAGDEFPSVITTDVSGNIYIAGSTTGSLGEANAGTNDVFLTKLNSSGVIQWTKQLGNVTIGAGASNQDGPNGIAIDSTGNNIFIAGYTMGSLGEPSAGGYDAFIAKFSTATGALSWIKQLGNTTIGAAASGTEGTVGYQSLALDALDNLYVLGHTSGSLAEPSAGNDDIFVARFSSGGALSWIKQLGNTTVGPAAAGDDISAGIVANAAGDVFITGVTGGSFGEAYAGGGQDAFIAKINAGGSFAWVKQLGNVTIGAGASAWEQSSGIALDALGNIYIAGFTQGALGEPNAGSQDAWAAKFSSSGSLTWIKQLGNTTIGAAAAGNDRIYGLTIDSAGTLLGVGFTGGSLAEPNAGSFDALVWSF